MPFLMVVLLIFSWGGIPATFFAIIGALRRRCPWYMWLIYICITIVSGLLYQGLFWIAPYLSEGDRVSSILSTIVLFLGIIPGFIALIKLLAEVWKVTNGNKIAEEGES